MFNILRDVKYKEIIIKKTETVANKKRYFNANVTVPIPRNPITVEAQDMQVIVPINDETILILPVTVAYPT